MLQEHEPLLPYGLFDAFIAVPQTISSEEKVRAYRELVDLLPPVSRALLGHLMLHLKQVHEHVVVVVVLRLKTRVFLFQALD